MRRLPSPPMPMVATTPRFSSATVVEVSEGNALGLRIELMKPAPVPAITATEAPMPKPPLAPPLELLALVELSDPTPVAMFLPVALARISTLPATVIGAPEAIVARVSS